MTAARRLLTSAPPRSHACKEASSGLSSQVFLPLHQAPARSGSPPPIEIVEPVVPGAFRPGAFRLSLSLLTREGEVVLESHDPERGGASARPFGHSQAG